MKKPAKRDYCTEDCTSIYDVPMNQIHRIRSDSPVICGCCKESFCPFKAEEKMFQWRPKTPIRAASKMVTIYCEKCLDHFMAVTCPFTRGVASFKKSKKIYDRTPVVPRRADMLEWFHGPHEPLEVMIASIRPTAVSVVPVTPNLDVDAMAKED